MSKNTKDTQSVHPNAESFRALMRDAGYPLPDEPVTLESNGQTAVV